MSITLNPGLVSALNQLAHIPIPISKLIIDQSALSIINSPQTVSFQCIDRIVEIEAMEKCNWRSAERALQFLLKYALKNGFPGKAIGLFLANKTMLSDLAEYISGKYQEIKLKEIHPPKKAKIEQVSWSACNLKQNRNKEIINKMYMKIYTRAIENGEQQEKAIICQLPQYKLLLNQISQMSINMK